MLAYPTLLHEAVRAKISDVGMMQCVVLGMHKSGTTLIAKTLHKSGISMGDFDESVGYDSGNQYERKEALIINNNILQSEGKQSLRIEPTSFDHSKAGTIKKLTEELNKEHEEWGFKDPRTCLTYSLWKPYLRNPKIIVVFRHPRNVASHYCKTGLRDYILALKRYIQYNKQAYKIGIQENALFVNYENLIYDKRELIRVEKFVDIQAVNIINASMNRSKDKYGVRFWGCNLILLFMFATTPLRLYKKMLKLAR